MSMKVRHRPWRPSILAPPAFCRLPPDPRTTHFTDTEERRFGVALGAFGAEVLQVVLHAWDFGDQGPWISFQYRRTLARSVPGRACTTVTL
jgi:hypothetical protein